MTLLSIGMKINYKAKVTFAEIIDQSEMEMPDTAKGKIGKRYNSCKWI